MYSQSEGTLIAWCRQARIHASMLVMLAALMLAATHSVAAPKESATDVVKRATGEVLEAVATDRSLTADQERLYAFVHEVVLPYFDFQRMSQRVLGKHWRAASPPQREAFVDAFQGLIVRTYATAITGYEDQRVDVQPGRVNGAQSTVRMNIVRDGGPPIPVVYSMGLVEDEWKVYDVTIEGVSLVITYRTTFSTEIRRSGMDGLIKRLNEHTGGGA